MMMLLTGRLPEVADAVGWEGWRFEIVDMDGKTIDKVLATRVPESGMTSDREIAPER
jgi:putative hemolysin